MRLPCAAALALPAYPLSQSQNVLKYTTWGAVSQPADIKSKRQLAIILYNISTALPMPTLPRRKMAAFSRIEDDRKMVNSSKARAVALFSGLFR